MGGGGGCAGPCRCFLVFVQGRSSLMRRGVVTPPYGCNAGGARQRADVGIGPYAPRGDEGRHAGSSCPTGGCGEPPRLPWPAAQSGASAVRMGGTRRNRSRNHPKSVQQRRTIPQSRLRRASFLCTREPCPAGDGGCGSPRRCAPHNDNRFLSFRGGPTGRRGNPSFYDGRGTGVRAAVPRAWPPPTKFRAEIWGVGQVVGPYGRSAEALGIRPYGCSAGGAQQRRVGRVSGISWTPPPPVRRSGCCRGSRRGP